MNKKKSLPGNPDTYIKETNAEFTAWEDFINHPPHYTQGIECADYIASYQMDFFQGNVIKYLTRFKYKGTPLEDLKKAKWYLERLIQTEEKQTTKSNG